MVVKFCKDTLFQDFADYGKQRNRPVVHGWFLGIFLVDGSHMRGFPLRGTQPVSRDTLNSLQRLGMICSRHSFKRRAGMLSGPLDLDTCRLPR